MKLGLIGKSLSHSFSQSFFTSRFKKMGTSTHTYENFELDEDELAWFVANNSLDGFNVTIPYKEAILNHLDIIEDSAASIGAVNTVVRYHGRQIGFNTDVIGFEQSLRQFYPLNFNQKAAILGTGGAAKAVMYVLEKLEKDYLIVSRSPDANQISYQELNDELETCDLIINTTPLGMSTLIDQAPQIDYKALDSNFYAFDLIYNPENSLFLQNCRRNNAHTKNGYEMLILQAEAAWVIWNHFVDKK